MTEDRNPYDILDVPVTATQNEITKAFRKLVQKWHPDKNKEDDGTMFREVQWAYEQIGTVDARQAYDAGVTYKSVDQVRTMVLRSIESAVSESIMTNVMSRLNFFFDDEKGSKRAQIKLRQGKIKDLQLNSKRFKVKDERPNLFTTAVENVIKGVEAEIKNLEDQLDMLTKVHAELGFYEEGSVVFEPVNVTTTSDGTLIENVQIRRLPVF